MYYSQKQAVQFILHDNSVAISTSRITQKRAKIWLDDMEAKGPWAAEAI